MYIHVFVQTVIITNLIIINCNYYQYINDLKKLRLSQACSTLCVQIQHKYLNGDLVFIVNSTCSPSPIQAPEPWTKREPAT